MASGCRRPLIGRLENIVGVPGLIRALIGLVDRERNNKDLKFLRSKIVYEEDVSTEAHLCQYYLCNRDNGCVRNRILHTTYCHTTYFILNQQTVCRPFTL
ncbi:hypothetical protein ABVT39_013944 [Epinephelus coioides]